MLRPLSLFIVGISAIPLLAQSLTCPPTAATSGRPCERFHFHSQLFNPQTRAFVALHGVNEYASQTACDAARDEAATKNTAIVDFVKRVRGEKYEADRIGPCHCDASEEPASSTYLTEAQREAQVRAAEDVRRRVRERLLNLDLTPDSELVLSLSPAPHANAMLAGPRLRPLPAAVAAPVSRSAEDLQMPKSSQPASPANAAITLPLATGSGAPAATATAQVPAATPAATAPASPAAKPANEPPPHQPQITETTVPLDEAPDTEPEHVIEIEHAPSASAQEAADAFVRLETERIQNVVNAIPDQGDENGEKVLEACTARIQALSNLRALILGSGSSSRIAQAARSVGGDEERLKLVEKLFGTDVAAHWIPKVTTDVVLPRDVAAEASPDRLLRESGDATESTRRRALYAMLSRAPLTEEQQLWLIPIVDRFVQ